MSGSLHTRRSLASAATMGLLLIFSLSSAVNGAAEQGATSPQVAAGGRHINQDDLSRGSRGQRPTPSPSTATSSTATTGALSSASTTLTPTQKTAAARSAAKASVGNVAGATTPPAFSGWNVDWSDNFNTPLDQTMWARYGLGGQAPGQGGMGAYQQSNAFTSGGLLNLRTQYANGAWSSSGISSGDFYSASGGRWEMRAKFPVSKGIEYVFLLYPDDGSWPPEVDIAEGRVNGPENMATYHWGSNNNQVQSFMSNPDMSVWHTYGAIIGTNTITYTFDGKPWATITNSNVTTKKLWIGFQCSAMDPNGEAKAYETVDNGVPGPLTPAVSDIQIDWVAHYAAV